ncbi:hypothetical protein [Crocosphaera sp.]|uniref:hypothetical protein n=1 Tax=Crocosphaera sp. TaxID=2729996 RepID=UPI003F215898|nr:hypothetical protein [Crocosphaera sp.]
MSLLFLSVTVSFFLLLIFNQTLIVELWRVNLQDASYPIEHPKAKLIKVTEDKAIGMKMLEEHIKPGDSCFVYGQAAIFYSLFQCENPTRIDTVASDFFTLNDANEGVASLRKNPPKWIIKTVGLGVPEKIENDWNKSPNFYGPFRQESAKRLHLSLQKMIVNYELVGDVETLIPENKRVSAKEMDKSFKLRLYKHKY